MTHTLQLVNRETQGTIDKDPTLFDLQILQHVCMEAACISRKNIGPRCQKISGSTCVLFDMEYGIQEVIVQEDI